MRGHFNRKLTAIPLYNNSDHLPRISIYATSIRVSGSAFSRICQCQVCRDQHLDILWGNAESADFGHAVTNVGSVLKNFFNQRLGLERDGDEDEVSCVI